MRRHNAVLRAAKRSAPFTSPYGNRRFQTFATADLGSYGESCPSPEVRHGTGSCSSPAFCVVATVVAKCM